VTATFLHQLQEDREGLFKSLLSRCKESTDPKVARVVGMYETADEIIKMIEGETD
jgi:hypothetical protein